MPVDAGSLLAGLPDAAADEQADALLARSGVRLLRIVSTGQATPDGDWYDQDEDEWVVVIAGSAELLVEGEAAPRTLGPGGWIYLPAHCRHRVVATNAATPTVWLALHLAPASG